MRQVVVLEPAGSVLVIRQHSLGSASSCATSQSTTTSSNALEATAANTPADHNQNRIVVVRSSALQPPVRIYIGIYLSTGARLIAILNERDCRGLLLSASCPLYMSAGDALYSSPMYIGLNVLCCG